jgi:3-dehydroquinate dehydratase
MLRIPFVLIAMGVHGSVSRAIGPVIGTAMTYCCTTPEKDAGPGQLSVQETRQMIKILKTKLNSQLV